MSLDIKRPKITRPANARPAPGAGNAGVGRPGPRPARPGPRPLRGRPTASGGEASQVASLEALGNLLKTKREIHGLTRRDIVVKIKIPPDQLESIEDGRLSSLPPVFAKGFLRAYANELGLEAENLLEDYRRLTGGFKNEPASREPLAPRYVESSVGPGAGWQSSTRTLIIGGLVIAALAVTLWLWPGLRSTLGAVIPFLDQVPGFEQAEAVIPAGEDQPPAAGAPTFNPEAENPFVVDPLAETNTLSSVSGSLGGTLGSSGTTRAPAQAGGTLILSSQQDRVWVQLRVDQRPPEFLWLKSGQQITRRAAQSVTVTSGQANAVNINWNGQNLGQLSNREVDEATFPGS
ncbi:MAG: helix-turn-helix domain-containing protein [Candidatus Adiutrix sp.]|jgi:hypothetical protein|nr:helix-turn-helix domain-containing protein [Candidatus Adiutrix sp.]